MATTDEQPEAAAAAAAAPGREAAAGPPRWVVGLAWACAIGLVLLLALYPDALARLRARFSDHAEMDPGCDLAQGPCTARWSDGTTLTLTLGPQPLIAPGSITLGFQSSLPLSRAELSGIDMNMGLIPVPLEETAAGQHQGRALLPVCTVEQMTWRADVLLGARSAHFTFVSSSPRP